MSVRRIAALETGLLLVAMFANATAEKSLLRIKVLDSETRSASFGGDDIPKNCDQVNFDAYCNNSRTATVTNTLLVQEDDGAAFRVACTIDSRWSGCAPLAKGETFDARREKRGLVLYYVDNRGKARKQLYTLVDANGKASPTAVAVAIEPRPVAAAPAQSSAAPAPALPIGGAQQAPPAKLEKVKCNFTSTPAGAEITLDGKYVGNTPSAIDLTAGTHAIALSMAGFTQWKRDLTVLPGSELSVSAILLKQQ
jgi:PEGA domain-containing protein